MARSDDAGRTTVLAVALLFSGVGSNVAEDIVAILSKLVPTGVPPGTLPVSVKVPPAPDASVGIVHVTVPPAPTAGVVQVQPAGGTRLTNGSGPGSGAERCTAVVASRPS